jgi:hypothetical protein
MITDTVEKYFPTHFQEIFVEIENVYPVCDGDCSVPKWNSAG